MGTPFDEVYSVFLSQITDYNFLCLPKQEADAILERFLMNAIAKFTLCRNDLSNRDDVNKRFNVTLTGLEVQILAHMMIVEWVTPMIYNIEIAKQYLQDKDFKVYSQANHLKELRELRDDIVDEVDRLMIQYTYGTTNGIEELR